MLSLMLHFIQTMSDDGMTWQAQAGVALGVSVFVCCIVSCTICYLRRPGGILED